MDCFCIKQHCLALVIYFFGVVIGIIQCLSWTWETSKKAEGNKLDTAQLNVISLKNKISQKYKVLF